LVIGGSAQFTLHRQLLRKSEAERNDRLRVIVEIEIQKDATQLLLSDESDAMLGRT
jgi:hypothetical protein